jgi:hypothetical protein
MIPLVLLASSIAGLAPADAQQPPPRPCAAIRQVCLNAGFVANGARAGEGVVVDCIRPIMQGSPQRPRASKQLPAVDPALVEACRAQNPNFGVANAQGPRNGPGGAPQRRQGPGQGPGPGPADDGPPPQEGPGGPPAEPPQGAPPK